MQLIETILTRGEATDDELLLLDAWAASFGDTPDSVTVKAWITGHPDIVAKMAGLNGTDQWDDRGDLALSDAPAGDTSAGGHGAADDADTADSTGAAAGRLDRCACDDPARCRCGVQDGAHGQLKSDGRWVTINGNHVYIEPGASPEVAVLVDAYHNAPDGAGKGEKADYYDRWRRALAHDVAAIPHAGWDAPEIEHGPHSTYIKWEQTSVDADGDEHASEVVARLSNHDSRYGHDGPESQLGRRKGEDIDPQGTQLKKDVARLLQNPRSKASHHRGQLADLESSKAEWNALVLKGIGGEDDAGSVPGFTKRMERELRAQAAAIIEALRRLEEPAGGRLSHGAIQDAAMQAFAEEYVKRVRAALRPYVQSAVKIGGDAAMAALQAEVPGSVEIGFDVFNPRVQQFVDEYTVRLADAVNGTTRVQAIDILGRGLEQGESIPQLITRVKDWAGEVGDVQRGMGARAENIARTESSRAYQAGQLQGWKESGIVTGKKWLLAAGACPICEALAKQFNDKVLKLDEHFYRLGDTIEYMDGEKARVYKVDYENIAGPPVHPQCGCDLIPVLQQ